MRWHQPMLVPILPALQETLHLSPPACVTAGRVDSDIASSDVSQGAAGSAHTEHFPAVLQRAHLLEVCDEWVVEAALVHYLPLHVGLVVPDAVAWYQPISRSQWCSVSRVLQVSVVLFVVAKQHQRTVAAGRTPAEERRCSVCQAMVARQCRHADAWATQPWALQHKVILHARVSGLHAKGMAGLQKAAQGSAGIGM